MGEGPAFSFALHSLDVVFPRMSRTYYVYILASRSRAIYTGVTNNLQRRIAEHHAGLIPGFTSKYKISRLVHFERFADIRDAIMREKQIKKWRREEKIALIEKRNPTWVDLTVEMPVSAKK
jgi:putative endonuclease